MSPSLSELKKTLPPEKYNKLMEGAELTGISLVEINAKVNRRILLGVKEPKIRIEENFSEVLDREDNIPRILAEMNVDVPLKGRGENPLSISAKYIARFSVEGDVPVEFWQVYKQVTFPIQVWPLFRELVQSITSRMGVPPITLPMYRV